MTEGALTSDLQSLLTDLRKLKRDLEAESTRDVNKVPDRDEAKRIATAWRRDLVARLRAQSWHNQGTIAGYDGHFKKLLQLSISPNRRSTYLGTLQAICKSFRMDLIIPSVGSGEASAPGTWDEFLAGLPATTEGDYFKEAVDCAKAGYLRAATVMGWCACVDHMHRKVAAIGFATFSKTSERLAAQTVGRFKRFNKKFAVETLADLRATVFDDDLLTVVEGCGLIDNNEFRRLRSCFDLRNQAAHPGDAAITEYNLMSFFSDVVGIVIGNEKFAVTGGAAG